MKEGFRQILREDGSTFEKMQLLRARAVAGSLPKRNIEAVVLADD